MRRGIGWGLIVAAVIANRWVVGSILAPDGEIRSFLWNVVIFVAQVLFLLAGLFVLRAKRLRVRASDLLLMGAAIFLSVLLAELGARTSDVLAPSPRTYPGERENRPSANFVADPVTGWRMRPNHSFSWTIDGVTSTYVADDEGYRTWGDAGRRRSFQDGQRRVVLVGDSFTFGTGVDYRQTFGALIASSSTAVRNLAMPGFGIDQMWTTVSERALALDPDLVIVSFIDEDLDRSLTAFRTHEGLNKPSFLLEDGQLRPLRPNDRPHALWRWIEARSWLLSAGRSLMRSTGYRVPLGEWWRLNRALFIAMQARSREAGIPLLFVRLPLREPKPFPVMAEQMQALGAAYLDLSSSPPDVSGPIHFANDGHIDARGHRWVAERLKRVPIFRRTVLRRTVLRRTVLRRTIGVERAFDRGELSTLPAGRDPGAPRAR